jgi:hypothetical protein
MLISLSLVRQRIFLKFRLLSPGLRHYTLLKVDTNIFEKHAAYTFSINGSPIRVQSADMGKGKEGGQRGL